MKFLSKSSSFGFITTLLIIFLLDRSASSERISDFNSTSESADFEEVNRKPKSESNNLTTVFLSDVATLATVVEPLPTPVSYEVNVDVSLRPQCSEGIRVDDDYVLLRNGSLLIVANNALYNISRYYFENETLFVCVSDDDSTGSEKLVAIETATSTYNFSKEFMNCGHILLEPNEFRLLENKSIYIKIYERVYKPTDYYLQQHGVYVCLPHFAEMQPNISNVTHSDVSKFSQAFVYVSLVGLGVSIVSLVLHLLVFFIVPNVQNLPGCCLASLSLSLLLAYLCFVSSSATHTREQCATLGASVYYFFLTSFFWMNVIAFDVWRSFRVVMKQLRLSTHRIPWRRFFLYSSYCWLTPAALTCIARVADETELLPRDFRPSFGSPICWFGKRKALLVFFACPLFIIMTINAIFFLDSTYVINVATMKTSQSNQAMLKRRFFMFMRLALIMGLTWIVGIVAGYVDLEPLWYMFVVLNTLQGLFIFIVFSCSSKVRGFFCNRRLTTRQQSTSVRTISQVSAAL